MEWQPEQQDLGGLGFAGIWREIYRVSRRTIFPVTESVVGATFLSAVLLAHITAYTALLPGVFDSLAVGAVVRFFACLAALIVSEPTFLCVLLFLSCLCTAMCVFRVASLYCTDGDPDATNRILRDLPRAPLKRLYNWFSNVFLLAFLYIASSALALLLLSIIGDSSDEVFIWALKVLGAAAVLASAAYVAVVSHMACVAAVLEDDAGEFGAVRKSRALLAGKLGLAAAVFVPLDVCFLALQIFFVELVLYDALGLGIWFNLAAGAAMAVALWAVVLLTLVAQPVVYLACKNHHKEVVDKVHLNYVGEYQQLVQEGDNGVELQPVNTVPQPTASPQCPGQSAASTSTSS